jgi:hypothetical protein
VRSLKVKLIKPYLFAYFLLIFNNPKITATLIEIYMCFIMYIARDYQSQWPRGLRRGSAAARVLGLQVRIPPVQWMSVSSDSCVLSSRGLRVWLIIRPEVSYRVRSRSLDNEEALAH